MSKNRGEKTPDYENSDVDDDDDADSDVNDTNYEHDDSVKTYKAKKKE